MADVNFSLGDLFEQVFGYKSEAFEPDFKPIPNKDSVSPAVPLRKEYGLHGSPLYATDANGREYYLPVTITYAKSIGTAPGGAGGLGSNLPGGADAEVNQSIKLPYTVVSISSRKRIVKTELTERAGTVKELINRSDYDIVIKG